MNTYTLQYSAQDLYRVPQFLNDIEIQNMGRLTCRINHDETMIPSMSKLFTATNVNQMYEGINNLCTAMTEHLWKLGDYKMQLHGHDAADRTSYYVQNWQHYFMPTYTDDQTGWEYRGYIGMVLCGLTPSFDPWSIIPEYCNIDTLIAIFKQYLTLILQEFYNQDPSPLERILSQVPNSWFASTVAHIKKKIWEHKAPTQPQHQAPFQPQAPFPTTKVEFPRLVPEQTRHWQHTQPSSIFGNAAPEPVINIFARPETHDYVDPESGLQRTSKKPSPIFKRPGGSRRKSTRNKRRRSRSRSQRF